MSPQLGVYTQLLNTNNPVALSACSELIPLCEHPSPEIIHKRGFILQDPPTMGLLEKDYGCKDAMAPPSSSYCLLVVCRFPDTSLFYLKERLRATSCLILSGGKLNLSGERGSSQQ